MHDVEACPTPSLDDIRLPIELEETKKKGGWDFGDMTPEPVIPPPEDWPIYGPPTPSMDFPTPSLDDIRPPVELEEPKKKGGWDFGDVDFDWKGTPEIPPPEAWPIYGPPTPGAFEGMFDGYEEEVVPPLGITEEELARKDPGPIYPRKPGPIEFPDPGARPSLATMAGPEAEW